MSDPSPLPIGVTTVRTTDLDTFRNRIAGRLANAAMRIASPEYRKFVAGAILYGMDAAARDLVENRDSPPPTW